ncbi:phosphate ABC transporter substrate-binding protein [Gimesia aquarii]|uniref:Phosphate-binding protein PstS 1 n=1 Tax=Gimesia aquarii TaxID=2527964 RepID=A0A517VNN8_9PLAN|nr:phosphate ABC transporter substrate-binding protein [Gimesia aquarii]QDT94609.1 Phosphate-binding protein PstS 1 precursor [Gimesia aquarii]
MPQKNILIIFFVSLISTCAGYSCSSSGNAGSGPTSKSEQLVLTGSSTVAPLAVEIGKRFESLHPGIRIDVQTGGSSRGTADARRGLADIGMASRALKPEEEDLLGFTIAQDGVCVIIHGDNSVNELSDEQIAGIFSDKINNWKEVGGQDAPITVVNKSEGRATLEVFLKYFKLKNSEIKADVVIGDNEQGIKTISGNRNAIGYVSIGTAEFGSQNGVPIKLLPAGGVKATTDNLAKGTFPISRPLNFVTKTEPEGLIKEFIDFAQSDQVHDLVKEQYFVPTTK